MGPFGPFLFWGEGGGGETKKNQTTELGKNLLGTPQGRDHPYPRRLWQRPPATLPCAVQGLMKMMFMRRPE